MFVGLIIIKSRTIGSVVHIALCNHIGARLALSALAYCTWATRVMAGLHHAITCENRLTVKLR